MLLTLYGSSIAGSGKKLRYARMERASHNCDREPFSAVQAYKAIDLGLSNAAWFNVPMASARTVRPTGILYSSFSIGQWMLRV